MEKCRFCQTDLEEGNSVCPNCGKDNAQEETAAPELTETSVEPEQVQAPEQPEADPPAQEKETGEASTEAGETAEPQAAAGETAQAAPAEPEATPIQEGVRATPGKIALAVAAVVVLLAALIALVMAGLSGQEPEDTLQAETTQAAAETVPATVPADGNPEDVTCKGTYTVGDEEALANRDTVVAKAGDYELTNGQLQVYYWMEVQGFLSTYGAYAPYFGLDYTQPLDTQISMDDENLTWQQFFLQNALNNWQQTRALAAEAEKNNLEMSQESRDYLDNLEQSVEELAQQYDVTVEDLLLSNFGTGAGMEEYRYFQELYESGYPYYAQETNNLVPTDQDLEDFFALHEEDYANSGLNKEDLFVDVRHILIQIEGGTTDEEGNTTYSDEEWETCRAEAQAILDEWLAGDKTEDSFAALATEKSEDPGSQAVGGLYQQVYEGQMVQPFNDWCFDESRQTGDYGLVKTDYGYHVMYFVSSEPQWKYYTESDWKTEQSNQMMAELVEQYPLDVAYENITLANVEMGV